jgi:hypothetical protein
MTGMRVWSWDPGDSESVDWQSDRDLDVTNKAGRSARNDEIDHIIWRGQGQWEGERLPQRDAHQVSTAKESLSGKSPIQQDFQEPVGEWEKETRAEHLSIWSSLDCLWDKSMEDLIAMFSFFPSLENNTIARANRTSNNLRKTIWSWFEDDQENANRAGQFVENKILR